MTGVIAHTTFDQVIQWWKNGDHPNDDIYRRYEDTGQVPVEPREGKIVQYYRHYSFPGNMLCPFCSKTLHSHGWIDFGFNGQIVCAGDYILRNNLGRYFVLKSDAFESLGLKITNGD